MTQFPELQHLAQETIEIQTCNANMEYDIIAEKATLVLYNELKPVLSLDGSTWCVLLGENIQVGVSGWGDTPLDAIKSWDLAMRGGK